MAMSPFNLTVDTEFGLRKTLVTNSFLLSRIWSDSVLLRGAVIIQYDRN
jgi:hypothetical protein